MNGNSANQAGPLHARIFEAKVIEDAANAKSPADLLILHRNIEREKQKMADFPDVIAHIEGTKYHVEKRLAELNAERDAKGKGTPNARR